MVPKIPYGMDEPTTRFL
ncbi:hypothetical protein CANINC_002442, partial [Pichia inconspicua]